MEKTIRPIRSRVSFSLTCELYQGDSHSSFTGSISPFRTFASYTNSVLKLTFFKKMSEKKFVARYFQFSMTKVWRRGTVKKCLGNENNFIQVSGRDLKKNNYHLNIIYDDKQFELTRICLSSYQKELAE